MRISARAVLFLSSLAFIVTVFLFCLQASAQSSAGIIQGVLTDPTNAVVPGATVEIHNPVSGYNRRVTTDNAGRFTISNIPYNNYHLSVSSKGFNPFSQDVEVRSAVPVNLNIGLKLAGASETVTVEGGGADLIEADTTFHTDIDRDLFNKVPLESSSSSVSSLVTLTSPGIAADSNGLFHGMGDHAENSFSVDGQPITDQCAKQKSFPTRFPWTQSSRWRSLMVRRRRNLERKTSVVINVTTRSRTRRDHRRTGLSQLLTAVLARPEYRIQSCLCEARSFGRILFPSTD